jgi:glycosyltransferase involved in cell wall biosynthesis
VTGQLRRRAYLPELQPRIRSRPYREIGRLLAPRAGLRRLVRPERGPFSIDAVYRSLDGQVAQRLGRGGFDAVYAYEDGAAESFRVARERGVLRIYDLPIGYWRAARAILEEEAKREPEWASTITGNHDSARKTARKDAELREADLVFVASSFTLRTLDAAPDFHAPVAVLPYGAPVIPAAEAERTPSDALRVLFVGGLSQRKGLSYLFGAIRTLRGAATLTVIGSPGPRPCAALQRELAGVRWLRSCPHSQVLAEMAQHDVFVFPSLFEGFGLVLLEAMAAGLPVVTTPHTAGPDLIDEGVEGHIVPIRSAEAIAEKLSELRADPARRRAMGEAARRRAMSFSWSGYGDSVAACVASALARR